MPQRLDGGIRVHDDSATGGNSEPRGRSLQQENRARQPRPLGSLVVRVDDHGDELEHIEQLGRGGFRCLDDSIASELHPPAEMPTRTAPWAYRPRITSFMPVFRTCPSRDAHHRPRGRSTGHAPERRSRLGRTTNRSCAVGDSNCVHRRLEYPAANSGRSPIGGTDVSRAEWCVPSQSIEGCLEEQSVLPLPEQQLTVRQQIERLEFVAPSQSPHTVRHQPVPVHAPRPP